METTKKPTAAQQERQNTRKSGKYSTMNKCDLCGKGVGHYYFSVDECNSNGGFGLVLHGKCAEKWESDPVGCLEIAKGRRC